MLVRVAVVALLAASAAGGVAAGSTTGSAGGSTVAAGGRASQETVVLLTRHSALAGPRRGSTRLRQIGARRPITGERTVLPVVGHAVDRAGRSWLRVMVPGRPNGRRGWIERAGTRSSRTDVHLVVRTGLRQVVVYRHGHFVRVFRAVVGRRATPTPRGDFFVEEAVALPSTAAGAPFALALSARSEVYQEFEGGPGQVAIHGRGRIGGTLGTASSHGCVRLDDAAMRWLVMIVGPGVPVTITP